MADHSSSLNVSQEAECNICHEIWFITNTTFNRTTFNCSSSCLLQDEKCYTFWDDVATDIEDLLHMNAIKFFFLMLFIITFLVGVVGNFLVVLAVCRNRQMRTVTNIFILNLSTSDFLVIVFCLPATLVEDLRETWYLGLILCKGIKFFQKMSVFVSVLTLTGISIERFYAICQPLRFRSTVRRARIGCIAIWLIAGVVASSDLVLFHVEDVLPKCFTDKFYFYRTCRILDNQEHISTILIRITTVFIFVLPFIVMSYAYTRVAITLWRTIPGVSDTGRTDNNAVSQLIQRRRTAKMLIVIVVFFFICYCPVHVYILLSSERVVDMPRVHPDLYVFVAMLNHILVYINSASNPLIYNFMSEKFRREFRMAFACCTRTPKSHFHSEEDHLCAANGMSQKLLAQRPLSPKFTRVTVTAGL